MRLILSAFFFILSSFQIFAQEGKNPFEIRTATKDSTALGTTDPESSDLRGLVNPFELRPSLYVRDSSDTQVAKIKRLLLPKIALGSTQIADVKNLLFWLLLFLTFLLAIAINLNRSITLQMFRSLFNLNYLGLIFRESREGNMIIYLILYGLYFIGLSIFLYLSFIYYKGLQNPYYIAVIMISICLIYAIRHLSLRYIGRIFGLSKELDKITFSIIIFGCILSMILIPVDFLVAFVHPDVAGKLIYVTAIFISLFYFFRILRDILLTANTWRSSLFHFLLYLCSCEIAPLVWIGVFLYRQGLVS